MAKYFLLFITLLVIILFLIGIIKHEELGKDYSDKRRRPLEFEEGDHVLIRVTPRVGFARVIKTRKLTPRFIRPFQILQRIGPVAYHITLPPNPSNLHDVFHVSQLNKYYRTLRMSLSLKLWNLEITWNMRLYLSRF